VQALALTCRDLKSIDPFDSVTIYFATDTPTKELHLSFTNFDITSTITVITGVVPNLYI